MVRLQRPGPASPASPSSSTNTASWIQANHDARLNEINSEVLHNADVAPPSYEELERSGTISITSETPRPAGASSTSAAAAAAPYSSTSKLARDLEYYKNNQRQQQQSNSTKAEYSGVPNKEEREAVRAHFDDLSDVDSDDSSWDAETIAGIDTPGTTVNGDYPAQRSIPHTPVELHRDALPDLSLLERIRQRHGLPPREKWTRGDWRLAHAEYKAERRAARANWRAERHALRAALHEQRKSVREERGQHRAERREERSERKAARRGGCCSR